MTTSLDSAYGYQGDNMNLPVKDVTAALPFYEHVLGFRVVSRSDSPVSSAVLARDNVQIRLAENGGDPTQDGCAFHVQGVHALLSEFNSRGLNKSPPVVSREEIDGEAWMVFYVVAPDGLCYWFGEREPH